MIAFRRPNTITKVPLDSGVRVLLVDTKVSRDTRTLVESVARLKSRHEEVVQTIMKVSKKKVNLGGLQIICKTGQDE